MTCSVSDGVSRSLNRKGAYHVEHRAKEDVLRRVHAVQTGQQRSELAAETARQAKVLKRNFRHGFPKLLQFVFRAVDGEPAAV